jgi:hypothetical protein
LVAESFKARSINEQGIQLLKVRVMEAVGQGKEQKLALIREVKEKLAQGKVLGQLLIFV